MEWLRNVQIYCGTCWQVDVQIYNWYLSKKKKILTNNTIIYVKRDKRFIGAYAAPWYEETTKRLSINKCEQGMCSRLILTDILSSFSLLLRTEVVLHTFATSLSHLFVMHCCVDTVFYVQHMYLWVWMSCDICDIGIVLFVYDDTYVVWDYHCS